MQLGLARRLAGKLTFGKPLSLQDTLTLETQPELWATFRRLLQLHGPVSELPVQFGRRYYLECPGSAAADEYHLFQSFVLFAKLQDVEMGRLLVDRVASNGLESNWPLWLYTVGAYAPVPTLALLLEKIHAQGLPEVFRANLDSLLVPLSRSDLPRYRELVLLLPASTMDWLAVAKKKLNHCQYQPAKVLLEKARLVSPNRQYTTVEDLLLDLVYFGLSFNRVHAEQVRQLLHELGYQPLYRQLVARTVDLLLGDRSQVPGGSRTLIEALKYYLAHDSDFGQNYSLYLAYIAEHAGGTVAQRHKLQRVVSRVAQSRP